MDLQFDHAKGSFSPTRIFCIGRNYVEHVRELNNPMPAKPVIFMKPPSSLVSHGETIRFPSHGKELHHETEVVVGIGKAASLQGRMKRRPLSTASHTAWT